MKCTNCGHLQSDGKFCEKCGGMLALEKSTEDIVQNDSVSEPADLEEGRPVTTSEPVLHETNQSNKEQESIKREQSQQTQPNQQQNQQEPNQSVEMVKDTSRAYGTYFMKYLKRPSQIHGTGIREFKNAIISSILLSALIALTFYLAMKDVMSPFGRGNPYMSIDVPFAQVFFGILILLVIFLFVTYVVLFAINKMYGTNASFKEIIAINGAYLAPTLAIAVISFVLILLKSYNIGGILLFASIGFMLSIAPIFIINTLLTRRTRSIDPFYGYVIYLVAIVIAYVIVFAILGDTMVGRLLSDMPF